MDFTSRDLGEIPLAPDMSNFKNHLEQQAGNNIIIGNFNIAPSNSSDKKESLSEIIKKESQDNCL